ncbi:hypothetical protein ROA7450_01090 [Roseovarius albus]|uniref:Uncharacterized protein n=1 Tax=Roseovarius albus TaxID=1247867 RepID=A0A1X6YNJ9_9RHOB|nr:hypothetical protein [Roseovarius albus]SLN26116.1 hypothetical protein ROA7450_01090 [Roseovarius albus]
MMWQIQPLLAWLVSTQGQNIGFAALAMACACGLCPKWAAILVVAFHLLLAFA